MTFFAGATDHSGIGIRRRTKAASRQFHKQPDSAVPKSEGGAMRTLIRNEQQLQKIKSSPGFIAALDQSGGSTPGALRAYGINSDAWSNEDQMYGLVHQMRTRIITC